MDKLPNGFPKTDRRDQVYIDRESKNNFEAPRCGRSETKSRSLAGKARFIIWI